MDEFLSAPIKSTFLYFPDSIYLAATDMPYKKLEQAASKSNEKAFVAPICVAV